PVRFGCRMILLLQPGYVVAVRTHILQFKRLSLTERFVVSEDLLEEKRDGPAVEQQMVVTPNEFVSIIVNLKQGHAQQRRFVQAEAALSIDSQPVIKLLILGCARQTAPVFLMKVYDELTTDYL